MAEPTPGLNRIQTGVTLGPNRRHVSVNSDGAKRSLTPALNRHAIRVPVPQEPPLAGLAYDKNGDIADRDAGPGGDAFPCHHLDRGPTAGAGNLLYLGHSDHSS